MLWFPIDRKSDVLLVQQVYKQIRNLILTEQLGEGVRLPSTRELADSIGVSRNTVTEAYDQLILEGYVFVKPRSGTYVAKGVVLKASENAKREENLSKWLETEQQDDDVIDFRASHPAMTIFRGRYGGD